MKIAVKDPDYYYKTQHRIRDNNNGNVNDLHQGHQIKIDRTGYWNGKRHYGVFIYVYDPITGSKSATNIKHFKTKGK